MDEETYQGCVHDAFEEGDPGMTLVLGCLVSVALEGVGWMTETGVGPVGDAARGEETRGRVREMEIRETGVEGALGRYVPAESDAVDATEGEVGLPFETLDVGAEEGGEVARGCYPEGGLYDGETVLDGDGGESVQGETSQQGRQVQVH